MRILKGRALRWRTFAAIASGALAAYIVALVFDSVSVPLDDAVQVVTTAVVASATVAYVKLTRDLVEGQRILIQQTVRARRDESLLKTAAFVNRELWVRVNKISSTFPLEERTALDKAREKLQTVFDELVQLTLDITDQSIGLAQDDLLIVNAFAKKTVDFGRNVNLVLKAIQVATEATSEIGGSLTWESVKTQYYLKIRNPNEDPEWAVLADGKYVHQLLNESNHLVQELRRRAGMLDVMPSLPATAGSPNSSV